MSLFRGPDGIRAGWRAALFVVLLLAFGAVVVVAMRILFRAQLYALMHLSRSGTDQSLALLAASEAVVVIGAALATVTMAKIERRSIWSYGLADRYAARHFGAGAFWGFVALSVLLGVLAVAGFFAVDGVALHGLAAVRDAVAWGLGFLAVGVGEELMFRGYLQTTLARGMGFWPAAVLLSLLFGASHLGNGGEQLVGVASAGSVGLVLCYALRRSGSLLWPIGFHAGWDWAQSYFYGTRDSGMGIVGHLLSSHAAGPPHWSGGTVGPEGSVLIFPTLLGVAIVIRATIRRSPAAAPASAHAASPPTV